MPGPLRYHAKDPNGKRRGPGYYYHRGRGIYSRKDDSRDKRYKAQGFRGLPGKIGSGVYRHTHDITGPKSRLMGLTRPRTPKPPRKLPAFIRGYKKPKKNPKKKSRRKRK